MLPLHVYLHRPHPQPSQHVPQVLLLPTHRLRPEVSGALPQLAIYNLGEDEPVLMRTWRGDRHGRGEASAVAMGRRRSPSSFTHGLHPGELCLVVELLVVVVVDQLHVVVDGDLLGLDGLLDCWRRWRTATCRERVSQVMSHHLVHGHHAHLVLWRRDAHAVPNGDGSAGGGRRRPQVACVGTVHISIRRDGPSHLLERGKVSCSILLLLELSETGSVVEPAINILGTVPQGVGEVPCGLADGAHE